MALENIDKMPKTTFKAEELYNSYRKVFTIICHYFLQWGALYLSYKYVSFFKSIKKASIFNKNYKNKNEQHFQILKVLFLCGIWGGLYFNTRLNWKRAFRSKTACRGFKSFCPCQNKKTPAGVFLFCC